MVSNIWLDHLSHTLTDNGLIAYIWNIDQDVFEWQGNLQTLLGLEDDQHPQNSTHFQSLINPQDVPQRLAVLHNAVTDMEASADQKAHFTAPYRIRRSNGMQLDVQESATLHRDEKTGDRMLCGFMRVSDPAQFTQSLGRAMMQPAAQPLSYTSVDAASVPEGRHAIIQKIHEWGDCGADGTKGAASGYLLVVGIDRLAMFNEAFGAQFTDELIEKTGHRLQRMVAEHGMVARIDGDVFALLFHDAAHSEMAAVAHYILNAFYERPLHTARGPIGIGISMGGILVRQRSNDAGDLIAKAEMAMRAAKERGRGRFVSYNEIAGEGQSTRLILQSGDAFMAALKDNRVKLAFQPVVHSQTSAVSFHESLIRFIDEEGKIHSAGQFIPAIEKLGLTRLVDRHALQMALQELAAYPELSLSVNVSNLTLTDPDWLRGLVTALRDRPQMASRLIIEITESAAMYDLDKTTRIVRTLRDMGCRVALDDFGSGYTAFSQLKQLDIDIVKIDKSFIRNISEKENHIFVQTLQALAEGVNIETVGEGAETMSEARMLAKDGVNHIQGYAFGFPSVERVWLPKDHHKRKFILSREEQQDDNAGRLADDLSVSMMDMVRGKL